VVEGGSAKVLGGSPRRGRLRGMVLGRAQVRDRGGEHRQADGEVAAYPPSAVRPRAASRRATSRSRSPWHVHPGIRPYGARAARS
jgi:hypothetical protein